MPRSRELLAGPLRCLDRDSGQVDHDGRDVLAAHQPGRAEQGVEQVLRGPDHDEDNRAVAELRGLVDDLGPVRGQRLGLGLGPVVHAEVQAGREQPAGQDEAHPARP